MAILYNWRVHPRQIKVGDLILQKIVVSDPTDSWGKVAPNWEVRYRDIDMVRDNTYHLATQDRV
ncbi:hypothetical protein GW17_00030330 [Ensete ventricosum]|nr:hypothetical protein GW17_00030330 [Ensete ventricosum]